MPYRRKDSPIWWASFTDASGKRIRCSTGTTDNKEAKVIEAQFKMEAFQQAKWGIKPSHTFEQLMAKYLKATAGEKKSEHIIRLHVRRLRKFFSSFVMDQLSATDIRQYTDQRKGDGLSNSTINRELEVLSASINYANREWEWALPNPVTGRMLKEPPGRVRWITEDESDLLINAAHGEPKAIGLADFIKLALNTGCRKQEMLGLEWARIDFSSNLIHLGEEHTKTSKRRSVPLNEVARQALLSRANFRAEHCPDSPWVFTNQLGYRINDMKRSFGTACRRSGIDNFRIHDMRHTCAAWLVSAGAKLDEVRDLLGHSSVTMTERYAHLSPDNVRSAVKLLDKIGHDLVTFKKIAE
jgi:integrase